MIKDSFNFIGSFIQEWNVRRARRVFASPWPVRLKAGYGKGGM